MRILLVLFLLAGLSASAAAQSDADRSAVQGTIDQQLKAFRADDGTTAYSFAAPGIKAMFPTVDAFMAMVRGGYPPVYRPHSYSFGALEAKDGVLQQTVEIVDTDGTAWTALYTLAKQPDGSWKITGCYLVKAPGESV